MPKENQKIIRRKNEKISEDRRNLRQKVAFSRVLYYISFCNALMRDVRVWMFYYSM